MTSGFATDPDVVADQAALVAAAWSPADAPESWRLTAAQFKTLGEDRELLAIAAEIEPDRLPPLLFSAAATFLVLESDREPLRDWFPRVGEPQRPLGAGFRDAYRDFCLDRRDRLLELCATHRYQMNEVGRCAHVLPAMAPAIAADREMALVDVGTGAGLALHLDRYRYQFRHADGRVTAVGDPESRVEISTELRGAQPLPLPSRLPCVSERIGIDVEPLELQDADVRAWIAACLPQDIGAVTRFHHAVEVAMSHDSRLVRGDACTALPEVLASIPEDRLVCLVDTYVHVFFPDAELRRFRELVEDFGTRRDLDWISLDPLIPMGHAARSSVIGVAPSADVVERNRVGGAFGVLGVISYRDGVRSARLLAMAHPGAAWVQGLDQRL